MHAVDMYMYGHKTFLHSIEDLDLAHVNDPGVCGVWSAKDVVGHLAAFEGGLIDILNMVLGNDVPTPFINTMMEHGALGFNDVEAAKRKDTPYDEVLKEYHDLYAQAMDLLKQIPPEQFTVSGLLEWYGDDYDLDDFLVYSYYGHKREHSAQINILKDRLKDGS